MKKNLLKFNFLLLLSFASVILGSTESCASRVLTLTISNFDQVKMRLDQDRRVGIKVRDVDNNILEKLGELKALTKLDMSSTTVSDDQLEFLNSLSNLEDLSLSNTEITDAGLKKLVGLTNLKTLRLSGTKITGKGLRELKNIKNLELIHVDDLDLTGQDIADLKKHLPNIKVMGLTKNGVMILTKNNFTLVKMSSDSEELVKLEIKKTDDEILKSLKELDVDILSLSDTAITDDQLKYLQPLKDLDTLWLSNTGTTDAGLKKLVGLTNLKTLGLSGTKITDKGLQTLKYIKSLRLIHVDGVDLTDQAVADLKQHLPNLKVSGLKSEEKRKVEELHRSLQKK